VDVGDVLDVVVLLDVVVGVVEVVDVVLLDVDVVVPMSMTPGGSAGSMNVVVVVAGRVVVVEVVVDVEVDVVGDVAGGLDGLGADPVGGGMHAAAGAVELGGVVELGGSVAEAVRAARTIESALTVIVARRMAAAPRPPPSRHCTARTATPVTSARVPSSSAAPGEPPEAGRLHSVSMAVGGRGGQRDGADHSGACYADAAKLQPFRNVGVRPS
jgi:hypothetical protein